ncbi:hypothetical protein EJ05DRAFT_485152 [Pseudovirgaria hyperparasitica]|uniref:Velvet domain-containing protein n=1 Tax=Pseudovirgaria hyperparasitica TaxID=470096 RepID=A0A6A6WB55_9PEZI|nr:uncharacterized protein EJ05DRAFT_485152 [Pseudovirgaria hyperparasitica]KAF2759076.1 hypothetical protein EJ05DRAFT_485152 [Pseudovirgaria hyperparasitica]
MHGSRHGRTNHGRQTVGHHHDASRRGPKSPGEAIGYEMDVIVQPPARARVGALLQPAVTVRLRPTPNRGIEAADITEASQLLVMVSLMKDEYPVSSERLQHLFFGRRVDSIRPFSGGDESAQNRDYGLGYASFSDLIINEEGTYRLRLTLIKMHGGLGQPGMSNGGTAVGMVDSNTIKVRASP